MQNKIKSFFDRFKLDKFHSDCIHESNRKVLERIFLISLLFGTISYAAISIFNSEKVTFFYTLYYSCYIVIGLMGLVLCNIPYAKYAPEVFCLISFYTMLTFFMYRSLIGDFYLFFADFSFVLIMVLNLNPFIFSFSVIIYMLVLIFLVKFHIFSIIGTLPLPYLGNVFIVNVLIIYLSFWKRHSLLKKYNGEEKILKEQLKSEVLLLNTLPYSVMEELKETGKSVPKSFENTTVLYLAISNFDELSQNLPAQAFVNLLNVVIDTFDSIIENESCYRVKTTNNVYMAICGLPEPDPDHAARMVSCAIRFMNYIKSFNEKSDIQIRIRIGLNSGKVVAGIVGSKKYIYDVFGDTVNIACRMEMLCDEMKIRLTTKTYELSKEYFESTLQTPIMVKGKGMMESYYISDFS